MGRRDTFPLVDRLVPGGLTDYLRAARTPADKRSHEDIAVELLTEHDIKVSTETVRRWCQRVGADPSPTEPAEQAS